MALLALVAAALWVRLASIDFALPFFQESDGHVFRQIHLLGLEELTPELWKESSIYPHLLARAVTLFPNPLANPPDPDGMTLAQHLEWAGRLSVLVRSIVAVASVLLIPATWLLARRLFTPGWSLLAAALCAFSLLNLQFGQMARPHAFAAPFSVLGVAAAVRLRRRPDLASYLLCGLTGALAVASLQSGVAVLLPFAAAFALRERAERRWLEPKLLFPLALMALAVRVFWPFAFVSVPGAETGFAGGTIRVSDQTVAFSEFNGAGFPTVFLTLWYYETATTALAILGLVLFVLRPSLVRRGRADGRASDARRDLLVMLSYAIPYLVAIGLHERAQQRFVIPLLPFAALLATAGLAGLVRLVDGSRRAAQAVGLVALALPVAATVAYARLHERPHTQQAAADWIAANVAHDDLVGVHLTYDLPLARRLEDLFVDGQFGGQRRAGIFSPWQFHQCNHMGPSWRGERRALENLYVPAETDLAAVQADPEAWLEREGYKYVVVPGEHGASFHPLLMAVRGAAANIGTLVMQAPRGPRLKVEQKHEGLDTAHYTAFILTAPELGPELEIYDLDPPRR